MKAKKSYGQHFLKEESIASKIAQSLQLTDTYNNILEVGPGMGILTKYLLEYTDHEVKVVEADGDMVVYLTEHYIQLASSIVAQDFLKVRLDTLFEGEFALIGNYPYNISSQILFKQLDYKHLIPEMVGMFQKEVAERVVAKPNTKAYGILSVLMQAFYETEYLFTVKPGSFNPPPKVQSAAIRLTRKESYEDLGCDPRLFKTVVKVAFGMRRKMLRNSMKQFLSKDVLFSDKFFEKRPENVTLEQYMHLTNQISNSK